MNPNKLIALAAVVFGLGLAASWAQQPSAGSPPAQIIELSPFTVSAVGEIEFLILSWAVKAVPLLP